MRNKLRMTCSMFFENNFLSRLQNFYSKKLYFLGLLILSLSLFKKSYAQINADGLQHTVSYNGTYRDLIIPTNSQISKIRFSLSGADGGAAILRMGQNFFIGFVEAFRYSSGGGNGAVVNGTFLVGTGPGKIPLGSTIRFIIGQKGVTGTNNINVITDGGTGSDYGGGGGGTAILYKIPGGTTWTLLGVAGGGGGAYQGVFSAIPLGDDGGAGEESINGANGGGAPDRGDGGINAGGGWQNANLTYSATPAGAGGGGRLTRGQGLITIVELGLGNIGEEYQFFEGGAGAEGGAEIGGYGGNRESQPQLIFEYRNGGFGYGGGGGAVGTGGGGGGYAGGGAGGLFGGGGGGGSYLNGIRETGNISGGGSDTEPDEGFATYQVILNQPPVANCKNISVYLGANGQVSISASDINDGSSDPDGDPITFSLSNSSFSCSNIGVNNIILTVRDNHGATATCTALVTVVDNTDPTVITQNINAYLDATGNVTITPAQVNNGSYDNCTIDKYELDISSFDCDDIGQHTVTLTVTDVNGNSASNTAVVTVVDNLPPIITSVIPGKEYLWPPDHKMHEIDITIVSTENCPGNGVTCKVISVSSNEPVNDQGDGDTSPDWQITGDNKVNLRAERSGKGDCRIYTITVECTDGSGNKSQGTTTVKVAHDIKKPGSGQPYIVGSTVNFLGEFKDKPGNTHTAKWLIDGSSAKGVVTEPNASKNGSVTGSYKFGAAGVYKLQMNVTDQKGFTTYANSNGYLDAIVVIYDPNGGFTYGGGWYQSPAGALASNKTSKGQVSYGYTVNYYKGATNPKGETQFKFGDFEFNAVNFDYLAISGARAQFKGTGKITGGQSGVGFIMTVIDGQLNGTGVDKVRMKIFNKNSGEVYYDNEPGVSEAANPSQSVGTNSTVTISTNTKLRIGIPGEMMEMSQPVAITGTNKSGIVEGLQIIVHPNPTRSNFMVQVKSSNTKDNIMLQVFDVKGRLVEARNNINKGLNIQFGEAYISGIYYLRILQGNEHKEVKLVKL